MILTLGQFIDLAQDDNDIYIYDKDGDYLDCGLGCHTKYLDCAVLSIWLQKGAVMNHICVQIDW